METLSDTLDEAMRQVQAVCSVPTSYTLDVPASTAAELRAMFRESGKRMTVLQESLRIAHRTLMLQLLGAPMLKRWDRRGCYHRRQFKKWAKKNVLQIEMRA